MGIGAGWEVGIRAGRDCRVRARRQCVVGCWGWAGGWREGWAGDGAGHHSHGLHGHLLGLINR